MSHLLNFNDQEIDLNSLFMVGFDPLKNLIGSIAKDQKDSLKRINDIENKVTIREKKIEELDRQLKKQENFMSLKFKSLASSASAQKSNGSSENVIIFFLNSN